MVLPQHGCAQSDIHSATPAVNGGQGVSIGGIAHDTALPDLHISICGVDASAVVLGRTASAVADVIFDGAVTHVKIGLVGVDPSTAASRATITCSVAVGDGEVLERDLAGVAHADHRAAPLGVEDCFVEIGGGGGEGGVVGAGDGHRLGDLGHGAGVGVGAAGDSDLIVWIGLVDGVLYRGAGAG